MRVWALVSNVDDIVEQYGFKPFTKYVEPWYEVLVIDYANARIENGEKLTIWYDGKQMEPPDIFWPMLTNADSYCLERLLTGAGSACIVDIDELAAARSKVATYQRLAKAGVRVPKTVVFFQHPDKAAITTSLSFPMVLKPDNGYGGAGVELVRSEAELDAYLGKLQPGVVYMAQEYIASSKGRDVRMIFVEGEYLRSMLRQAGNPDEFRSNVHVGGAAADWEPDDEMKELGKRIADLFDLPLLGVDFLFGEDGFVVTEVNAQPGLSNEENNKVVRRVVDSYLKRKGLPPVADV